MCNCDRPIDGDFFEHSFKNANDVFYVDTDNVEVAFNQTKSYRILITHNSDRNITEDLYQKFKQCGKFKLWFAQNVACKHNDLICLPIGLERIRWCKFNKFDLMMKCKMSFGSKTPEKMLYGNFSIWTNPQKRLECLNSFVSEQYFTNHIKAALTPVQQLTQEQYMSFCYEVLNHRFIVCPEGNGIDTHRFWETLYLGRIPVVLHNNVNDSFSDMPILILKKWSEFKEHVIEYDLLQTRSREKLNQSYWKQLISL